MKKYPFTVCYLDKYQRAMEMKVTAHTREDAFLFVEGVTGYRAICEKWELLDKPTECNVVDYVNPEDYPRPSKPNKSMVTAEQQTDVVTETRVPILDRLPRRSTSQQAFEESENSQPGIPAILVYEVPFLLFGAVMIFAENYFLFGKIEALIPNPFVYEMLMVAPFILFPIGMSFVLGAPIILSPALLVWLAYAVCR